MAAFKIVAFVPASTYRIPPKFSPYLSALVTQNEYMQRALIFKASSDFVLLPSVRKPSPQLILCASPFSARVFALPNELAISQVLQPNLDWNNAICNLLVQI